MPGVVLAEDEPKEYWIDTADEAPLGSIFECVEAPGPAGHWICNLENDRVQIRLSKEDYRRFTVAHGAYKNTQEGQYLMNGVYLPVLIGVLKDADQNVESYDQYRWFSSLDSRLEAVGCRPLGPNAGADRAEDAQRLLESPFPKMPMIANVEADQA